MVEAGCHWVLIELALRNTEHASMHQWNRLRMGVSCGAPAANWGRRELRETSGKGLIEKCARGQFAGQFSECEGICRAAVLCSSCELVSVVSGCTERVTHHFNSPQFTSPLIVIMIVIKKIIVNDNVQICYPIENMIEKNVI